MRAMSLLLNFHNARKRWFESSHTDSHHADSYNTDSHDADSNQIGSHGAEDSPVQDSRAQDNVFNLLPPQADGADPAPAAPAGRNVHPVDMTDLSRLAIDSDGRLYWDGKPVEVHRRLLMSREQIIGALVIGAFV